MGGGGGVCRRDWLGEEEVVEDGRGLMVDDIVVRGVFGGS